MKTQELSKEELREINGGGLLGGNDSASDSAFGGSLGIGNLLSTSSSSQDGDESSSSSFSAGNGINFDLAGVTKKITG